MDAAYALWARSCHGVLAPVVKGAGWRETKLPCVLSGTRIQVAVAASAVEVAEVVAEAAAEAAAVGVVEEVPEVAEAVEEDAEEDAEE